jgi:hypothetical protein
LPGSLEAAVLKDTSAVEAAVAEVVAAVVAAEPLVELR